MPGHSNFPKRAVVLAAGYGERLRPLTFAFPKPVLPLWGVPMLQRTLAQLQKWGVEEVMVNTHHLPELVGKCVRDYMRATDGAMAVHTIHEKEILGTGGVLKPLAGFIGNSPFWLVNGDIAMEGVDRDALAAAFEKSGGFAGCWVSASAGPRTVEIDPEGRICNWKSDVAGDWGTATYCGLALLSPDILKYLPPEPFSSIVQAYEKAMFQDARFVCGVDMDDAYWADCGTLESYLEAHAALDPVKFEGNPNVLFEGVKFLESADLAGCVATGGLIGGAFERTALVGVGQLRACPEKDALRAIVAELGWKIDDTAAQFLGRRGSDRSFWRLVYGDERAIAIAYDDTARAENAKYAAHAKFLSENGISVVKVLADLPKNKVLALEDCGDDSLESRANARKADILKLYAPVMEMLKKLHSLKAQSDAALEAPFDAALYKWERDLFLKEAAAGRWGVEKIPESALKDYETVEKFLSALPKVLLHRDAQSSNVLYSNAKPVFIDFQGMRMGPAAYDVASFLYDPYVSITEQDRRSLAKTYGIDEKELAFGAVQRLTQAIGAFARLAGIGKHGFAKHMPKALENLRQAAKTAGLVAIETLAEALASREKYLV